ncbi:undecaprenyl-diphosphatase UppP [Anoxybacter fermentans]|uniref:Undecaprenyl-diphosphatase n=1 Tax=Anoxybacter fermentans TaxID=1323375 RepID=A0A3S9SVW0_9FIRM|nr:undecaprenyl-diphosphatase UppP [Anoxybacter fermentans]AZR72431.1 undecaprenyl-diphosphatase UppP [Anoxybacter fermentans]
MDFTIWKAIILGIVQGATEFLPVSSSGHLVLFQSLFGLKEGALTFDVFLHFGTLIAIIIAFWTDIKKMLLFKKSHRHLIYMILIGIIPTGIIGISFKDLFEQFFQSVFIVGYMLLLTGVLLWTSESFAKGDRTLKEMNTIDALIIGFAQGLAIIPGISRSGSTIVAGYFRGLNRDLAARYSFLVALPVIFGATLLEVKDILEGGGGDVSLINIIAGTLAAVISGYVAIRFLLKIIREKSLKPFAYYCWFIGIIIIISQII